MEKKFSKFVTLIECMNDLNGRITKKNRFTFEFVDSKMFIHGLNADLAMLYALLWSSCDNFALYLGRNDEGIYIEVYYLG